MNSIKKIISRNINNYPGWRTSRKIIVIESDDWGSICMPSLEIQRQLIKKQIISEFYPYTRYDALASELDINLLFSIINEFKDCNHNHPVITANAVMTNPDFEKIRDSDFSEYFYELFTTSLSKYSTHEGSYNLWIEGLDNKLFYPQFHGREHVNLTAWMEQIRKINSAYRSVFNYGICYLGPRKNDSNRVNLRASYDTDNPEFILNQSNEIRDGCAIFEKIFGYKSKSFIAPNFIYHSDLNETLFKCGTHYIQGMKYQKHPILSYSSHELIRHYQGERNDLGQYYLVRNCVFEPSQYPLHHDNVGECLKGIQNAFFWKKPAIITSHRLNFIGFIHPENRERNLKQLRELLKTILKRWPDVEFMTSVELGDLIAKSDKTG